MCAYYKMVVSEHLAASLAVGLAVGMWVWHRSQQARRREKFLFLAPIAAAAIGVGVTAAASGTGVDKKLEDTIAGKVKGSGKYQPTYAGRNWDGVDWSCPENSVETGDKDNNKACITSQFHPPVWRWNGKEWSHSCPNGTVPTPESQWEKKCEIGYTARVQTDKGWECPPGTTDTGKNWDNSTWHEAQKQCRRTNPYTLRIMKGGKWQCPPFSTDSGRNWGAPHGEKQCKWFGPSTVP